VKLKPIKRRKDQLYINQQLWESKKLHKLLLLFNNALMTIMMIVMIMLATAILCSDFHILSKMGNIFIALRKYKGINAYVQEFGCYFGHADEKEKHQAKNLNKQKKIKKKNKKHDKNILYSTRCNFEDHVFLTNFELPSLYMWSAIRVN